MRKRSISSTLGMCTMYDLCMRMNSGDGRYSYTFFMFIRDMMFLELSVK